jgi:hypothetical protein
MARPRTITSAILSATLWLLKSTLSSDCCVAANLKVIEILPGAWWGESYRFGWQDMVILER